MVEAVAEVDAEIHAGTAADEMAAKEGDSTPLRLHQPNWAPLHRLNSDPRIWDSTAGLDRR
jgi:hypothetical protein